MTKPVGAKRARSVTSGPEALPRFQCQQRRVQLAILDSLRLAVFVEGHRVRVDLVCLFGDQPRVNRL